MARRYASAVTLTMYQPVDRFNNPVEEANSATTSVQLENKTNHQIAYKFRVNLPNTLAITPSPVGVMQPRSECRITLNFTNNWLQRNSTAQLPYLELLTVVVDRSEVIDCPMHFMKLTERVATRRRLLLRTREWRPANASSSPPPMRLKLYEEADDGERSSRWGNQLFLGVAITLPTIYFAYRLGQLTPADVPAIQ